MWAKKKRHVNDLCCKFRRVRVCDDRRTTTPSAIRCLWCVRYASRSTFGIQNEILLLHFSYFFRSVRFSQFCCDLYVVQRQQRARHTHARTHTDTGPARSADHRLRSMRKLQNNQYRPFAHSSAALKISQANVEHDNASAVRLCKKAAKNNNSFGDLVVRSILFLKNEREKKCQRFYS